MIPQERAHLYVAAITHPGMSGKNNEDRYAVSAHHLSRSDPTPSVLAVVADGIGGHRAGEVAAELAVESISHFIGASDARQPAEILHQAVTRASQVILERAAANPERSGMGATCVCAWVLGERLFAAWVGDSRLYLLREGQIQRLTVDHTWVQEAMDHGALTPEQARNHPNAHVIRRHLGSKSAVRPDLELRLEGKPLEPGGLRLLPGDRLLLCSDGLTDLVEDAEIALALQNLPRQAALESLVALANQRGGHDNITILSLEVPSGQTSGQKLARQQMGLAAGRSLLFSCLALSALLGMLAVLAAVLAWYLWLQPGPTLLRTATPSASAAPRPVFPSASPPAPSPLAPSPPAPLPGGEGGGATVSAEPLPGKPTAPAASSTPWPTHTPGPSPTLPALQLQSSATPP